MGLGLLSTAFEIFHLVLLRVAPPLEVGCRASAATAAGSSKGVEITKEESRCEILQLVAVADYREVSNSEQLQNFCAALFLGYVDALIAPGSGGGGGTSSDLKWGRDPKEDEMEYLKRCARKAKSLVVPVKRTGVKR